MNVKILLLIVAFLFIFFVLNLITNMYHADPRWPWLCSRKREGNTCYPFDTCSTSGGRLRCTGEEARAGRSNYSNDYRGNEHLELFTRRGQSPASLVYRSMSKIIMVYVY